MTYLYSAVLFPFIMGLINLALPKSALKIHKAILLVSTALIFGLSFYIAKFLPRFTYPTWQLDNLSALIMLAIGFFSFVISVYSTKFFSSYTSFREFSAYALWAVSSAMGIAFANNLAAFIVFWGFLGFSLFMLINLSKDAHSIARKSFIIIGGSDAILVLGAAILIAQGRNSLIGPRLEMNAMNIAAFICLALAAFAKAGAFPLHIWIPETAEKASIPVSSLLIASLDKLLGIYLLVRIVGDIFVPNTFITNFMMIIGAVTILSAVLMQLIQKDMKKLLGYCAVSQVGYMIIGIGLATPLGIIAGIFHMFNHTIYKTTLFLSSGSVEKQAGTTNMDQLGGLSKLMPITFATTLVAALAVSGVPPFNGFASKWLIYQELLNVFNTRHSLFVLLALVTAILGSGLTLASFIKLLHAVYFAVPQKFSNSKIEAPWQMWLPSAVLASICILFGVFAYQIPLQYIAKALPAAVIFNGKFGLWQPIMATYLVIAGIILGVIVYLIYFSSQIFRKDTAFYGTEKLDDRSFPNGIDFYKTLEELSYVDTLYLWAKIKIFDVYHLSSKAVSLSGSKLAIAHSGKLNTYLMWCLAGIVFILFALAIQ